MYDRNTTNGTTADALRARAQQARQPDAPRTGDRAAPVDSGERLATATRGDSEELRISWAEYQGKPFLNVRLWVRNASGDWWPDKMKGIAFRRHELAALATAVAEALDRAVAFATSQDGAR